MLNENGFNNFVVQKNIYSLKIKYLIQYFARFIKKYILSVSCDITIQNSNRKTKNLIKMNEPPDSWQDQTQ